jgi:carboxypeptidase PM20D1
MRRLIRIAAVILLALLAVVVVRTATVRSRQPPVGAATIAPASPVDLAATLSAVIQQREVNDEVHALLALTFPRTLGASRAQRIAGQSVLVALGGGKSTAPAALIYAHLDVVPASMDGWKFDPFAGTRDGDVLYGRGALDDKSSAVALLAAAEVLLSSGWAPARPIYLALGHDEETGGSGAAAMAAHLRAANIRLESILDEGGAIVDNKIPGLRAPAAAVAIVERGYLDLELCATAAPGHSSTPPASTSVGILSKAILRLEQDPPPSTLNPFVRETLTYPAAEMGVVFRGLMSNLWLTAPLVTRQMKRDDVTRALLGSSQAVTMVSGGVKPNVLPERACATVNYRLFPGTTPDDIVKRARTVIADARIDIKPGIAVPAPPPSNLDSSPGRLLGGVIRRHFPDAVVVPVVTPGATDSRHFAAVADEIFRFIPVHLTAGDLASMHGVNERISVQALTRAYEFYYSYLMAVGRGGP